ncbi:glycerol-3-phosphate dehydrogenase [Kineosphaera limosa]|uniref:Glycerol-3-phosphate dehydrogenase n=1 Tax=Kineosphaera limosa NBRC 100340 TaxID=1184609 RepID=K6WV34_9MICO|nr:glycerol-3-phosphate dehydrogenase/oxidase [Kineosphaera limosa]NYE02513.1 glycerol-3-phosphate dehydrogenase [Kineosphaera limosa]GAB95962.1 glycerol-3-phosphate dehydrogenase [Kineosphaera limosa NBRC 100340]
MSSALSPQQRAAAIETLAGGAEVDVLVVGGGVTGAGAALDAVTRGLTTGLLEARDYSSGTSSRSSKLIHGGLRYLEMLDFRLVAEALTERGRLLTDIAPHLVRPVPFLFPFTRSWERAYIGSGVAMYDAMARLGGTAAGLPLQRQLTRRQALKVFPGLKPHALTGALQYYDAQVDDARFVVELVRTAASFGALVANRVEITGFLRQGERVTGVVAADKASGRTIEIKAKQVINATGVWTDDTQRMLNERGTFKVRASKGVHIVVPKDRIHAKSGLILRTEKSVLFVIPWGRHWIIGTTDTDWELDKAHPAATSVDIEYLLDHVNAVLSVPLTPADVEGVYAGLRPLLSGESDSTSQLSREHIVAHTAPGLVVVAGGKYTTYRVMAKDAVDEVVNGLARKVPPSTTHQLPLLGAQGYRAIHNQRDQLAARSGLHPARIEHLLGRYGSQIREVLDLIDADPTLAQPLPGAEDYLRVEVAYAVSHEGARHLEDVLARRTRISIEVWDRGVGAAPAAAQVMAPILAWGEPQQQREVELYRERVAAERASQTLPDDESADAARRAARDAS